MRVVFLSKQFRNDFFNKVLTFSNYSNWKELYTFLNITRAGFEKYKNGTRTIPPKIYSLLSNFLDDKNRLYFSKKVKKINPNWGQKKGGISTYSLYPELFKNGRAKGLSKMLQHCPHFDISLILDENLAYFIGLFIGDGFSNCYEKHYITQFVGHKQEFRYYKNSICPYISKTFNLSPKIIKSKEGNFIRVNINSKELFLLLTKRFKIPAGRKSGIVSIPKEIISSSPEILLSCIAGIYDAEGCVFFDKRTNYTKPYPRINLHMRNPHLIEVINSILINEEIQTKINKKSESILIYGKENIQDFLKKVILRNPKHLNKLKSI